MHSTKPWNFFSFAAALLLITTFGTLAACTRGPKSIGGGNTDTDGGDGNTDTDTDGGDGNTDTDGGDGNADKKDGGKLYFVGGYVVGGTMSNMPDAIALVLQNNGRDDLTLTKSGSFEFATPLADGSSYQVSVVKHPNFRFCTVAGGTGTISSHAVTSIKVTCSYLLGKQYAYVVNQMSDDISGFLINDKSGAPIPLPDSPFKAGKRPKNIVMTPSKRYVYVPNTYGKDISGYEINTETGALEPLPGSPFNLGYDPSILAISASGQSLYITKNADYNERDPMSEFHNGSISRWVINSETGKISPSSDPPTVTGYAPVSMAIHPNGKYAYVANYWNWNLASYSVNPQNESLAEIGSRLWTGGEPYHVVVDSSGKYAYAATFEGQGGVKGTLAFCKLEEHGTLSTLPGQPIAGVTGGYGTSVAVEGTGKYAYLASWFPSSITAYELINGIPRKLLSASVASITFAPTILVIDELNKHLYISGTDKIGEDGSLVGYSIDSATGALEEIPGGKVSTGAGPGGMLLTGKIK